MEDRIIWVDVSEESISELSSQIRKIGLEIDAVCLSLRNSISENDSSPDNISAQKLSIDAIIRLCNDIKVKTCQIESELI